MSDAPFGRMRAIVNPRAGRGAVERGWPAARAVLDEAGLDYDHVVSERPGHASELARRALDEGIRYVVAVGGDGTIHEVVNGLMGPDGALDSQTVLGVLPAGSGCDFVRTFGLPREPAAAARHLLGDGIWGRLDIGRVRCRDREGAPLTRWYPNIAEAGLGATVVAIAARMPKWLGASVYRIASMRGMAAYKPLGVRLSMTGRLARGGGKDAPLVPIEWEGEVLMLVVANCQFYGGGMRVAPRAIPSDGMLDVLVAKGSKSEAMKTFPKMSKGEHVPSKSIDEYLATSVTLDADPSMLLEADGELLGSAPATFDLAPDALRLKI